MIHIHGVHKWYGALHVLDGVDLDVPPAGVLVIVGPSGGGKSTLIRCVNRLESIQTGEIIVDGVSVHAPSTDVDRLRGDIGMVFQSFNLFPHLTALKNITLAPMKVRRIPRDEAEATAMALLDRVGIGEKANAFPTQLSGGQQQRVAIARAMAMRPKVLLFDEPTSALDPEMIKEVLDVMIDLARTDHMTMICVSHEMGFARQVATEIAFMDGGAIVERARPEEFFGTPKEARTQAFLGKLLSH